MKKFITQIAASALLLAGLSTYAAQPVPDASQLLLKSGIISTSNDFEKKVLQTISSAELFQGRYYRIVQFNSIPTSAEKMAIESSGIRILNYIPNRAFILSIPESYNLIRLAEWKVRTILALEPEMKLARMLAEHNYPAYAQSANNQIDLVVQFFSDNSIDLITNKLLQEGIIIEAKYSAYQQLHVRVDQSKVDHLASLPFIKWIAPVAPPSTPDDTRGRSLHRANQINTDYSGGRHYDGAGVSISLADDGEVGPHIDFQGRLTNIVNTGAGGTHGDMTSGIAAGAGNLDPTKRGMGSGAYLYVHDVGAGPDGYDHVYNAPLYFTQYGAVITSTSYSQGCNDYDLYSSAGDQLVHDNPQFSLVFSAGNNSGADCGYGAGPPWGTITGGFKQGKNVIACANLDPYEVLDGSSSRGPSADGRVKPDISSNGADQMSTDESNTYQVGGGTSAACPGIAGICSELYQAYRELTGNPNPESPLIKAVLLNSAEDIGNPGPDFTYGWGRVNALRALQTLEQNRYVLDSVGQGAVRTFSIQIPAGVNQVRAMVYWLDPQGDPLGTTSLVNDLDMTISTPSSTIFSPWVLDPSPNAIALGSNAARGADHLNNVEQVTIDNPTAGTYTVNIAGTSVPSGPQRFYIVWEFRTDEITLTYPNGGEGFVPGETELLRWDAFGNTSSFNLEYSTDAGSTWTTINAAVAPNLRQFEWAIPSTVSDRVVVRISRGAQSDLTNANLAIIALPSDLTIDYVCIDTMQLSWTGVSGAVSYEISKLGSQFMDSIGTSNTTAFVIPISQSEDTWFSVRAIGANGGKGRRAIAIHKASGLQNCTFVADLSMVNMISPLPGNLFGCQNLSAVPISVNLRNDGMNTVTNFTISYSINGGTPVSEVYNGSLVHGAYLTYTFLTTADFSVAGPYLLECSIVYAGDQNSTNDLLQIQMTTGTTTAIPLTENFQLTFPPDGWSVTSSGPSYEWSQTTPIVGSDGNTTVAAWFDNFSYNNPGAEDYLMTMLADLNGAGAPRLTFDVAYSVYAAYEDGLRVDVSDDCGSTFAATSYYKTGLTLQTVATSNVDFTPSQANHWRNDTVDLTSYANSMALIRFANINDFGNNIYIDNVNVENDNIAGITTVTKAATIALYPNPATSEVNFQIKNLPSKNLGVSLLDSQGREVAVRNFERTGELFNHTFDVRSYRKGIYMLRITGDEKTYVLRLTVL
ncbi:MAG: S8 family peptidase [Bacteroidetes bacterium]|nr:S8 family peptidase [Bacteroidota bacterium]MBP6401090.1 S8 family peptidase [Bacteroidia bacterium]MBP6648096.1 S8 family peptidase [Bacteroidia bacterium]